MDKKEKKSTVGEAYSGAAKGTLAGGIAHILAGKAGKKSKIGLIKNLSGFTSKLRAGAGIGAGVGAGKAMLDNSKDEKEQEKKAMDLNNGINFSKGFLQEIQKHAGEYGDDLEDTVKATGAGTAIGAAAGHLNLKNKKKSVDKKLDKAWEVKKLKESKTFKDYKSKTLEGRPKKWDAKSKKIMKKRFRGLKNVKYVGKAKGALLGSVLGYAASKANSEKKD
jgi:hypothetical protein